MAHSLQSQFRKEYSESWKTHLQQIITVLYLVLCGLNFKKLIN